MYPPDIRACQSTQDGLVPRQDRPVGWYRDPAQPTGHRYWDGEQWLLDPNGRH